MSGQQNYSAFNIALMTDSDLRHSVIFYYTMYKTFEKTNSLLTPSKLWTNFSAFQNKCKEELQTASKDTAQYVD